MIKQCVIRTYDDRYGGYSQGDLEKKLKDGWLVKIVTPFVTKGDTKYFEYILEKEVGNND